MKKIITLFAIVSIVVSCGSYKSTSSTSTTTTDKAATKPYADVEYYGKSITADELKEALYVYASDEFEGRETGTPGQKKPLNI